MTLRAKLALGLADFLLVITAMVVALGLRVDFNFEDMARYIEHQTFIFPSFALVCVAALWLLGLYDKVWRYAGLHELVAVVGALTIPAIPFQLMVLVGRGVVFPRTCIPLAWMVSIAFCGGLRLLLRVASERLGRPHTGARVLIVGANDAGETLLRELSRGNSPYHVVGFVDDDPARARMRIRGVRVLGKIDDLPRLREHYRVSELVLAQLNPTQARRVMELCPGNETQLRVVPALQDVVEGRFRVSQLRELSIEDLLERAPVRHEPEKIAALVAGRRVMVTGAGGSIGSEISRQVAGFGADKLILLGRGENSIYEIGLELAGANPVLVVCDVRHTVAMRRVFQEHRPEIVFHAAAHKHVPMMESNVAEAVLNNVFGTQTMMELCDEFKTHRFILLSSDKAVNPSSVMGACKRLGELLLARRGTAGFASVRFGNVLGSRGSVVPTFRKQIAQGGPVTVTDPEMTRFFMTIPEAVTLVLQAATMARSGEIYILEMGQPIKIIDLARNLIKLSGYEPDVDIAIQVVGQRPGEKMHEELSNTGEETEKCAGDKIMRVVTPPPPAAWPGALLDRLREAGDARDDEVCRRLIHELLASAARQEALSN